MDSLDRRLARKRAVVAIPTLNEAAAIETVIRSLAEGSDREEVAIVVADGGSTDGTDMIVQRLAGELPNVSLVVNRKRLQSAGVNRVAETWRDHADVLIRCDAHCDYPPRYIERLLERMEETGAASVVVAMDSQGSGCVSRAVGWVSDTIVGSGGSRHRGGRISGFVDHGHHAAFDLGQFLAIGGYDETFSHNEDAEFDQRLRAAGGRIYLDADTRLVYHPRSGFGGLWRQYRNYGSGRARTARRHPGSLRARQLAVPVNLVGCLASIGAFAAFGWTLPLAWPLAYLAALALVSVSLAAKHRSKCGLLAGPAALVMHVAWAVGFLSGLVRRPAVDRRPAGCRALLVDPSRFTPAYDAGLAEGLRQAGVVVDWAVREPRPGERDSMSDEGPIRLPFYRLSDAGVPWLPSKLRAVAKGLEHLVGLARLVAVARRGHYGVVHFQWTVLPLADALAMKLLRRYSKVVLTVHDSVPFNGQHISILQNFAFHAPMKVADTIIVHTRGARDRLVEAGCSAGKVHVVPHGPLSIVGDEQDHTRPDNALWTFVLFGQLKPYKGLDILVEATTRAQTELRGKARVIIAGAAHMDIGPIKASVETGGIGDLVELRIGRLDDDEMADLFRLCDCFVFPYRQIDASGVFYLAKSWKRWIIASDVGVFSTDIAAGETGDLLPSGDVGRLAGALVRCAEERPVPRTASGGDIEWVQIGELTKRIYEGDPQSPLAAQDAPTGVLVRP